MKLYKTQTGTLIGLNEQENYKIAIGLSQDGLATFTLEDLSVENSKEIQDMLNTQSLEELDLQKGAIKIAKINAVRNSINEIVKTLKSV